MKPGVLVAAVALSACSANSDGADADDRAQTEAIELYRNGAQQVAGIEKDVRIESLQRRVTQLEREILEMKADPAEVDVDILTQRLAALEARSFVTSGGAIGPTEKQRTETNDPARAARSAPRAPAQADDTVRKAMEQKRSAER